MGDVDRGRPDPVAGGQWEFRETGGRPVNKSERELTGRFHLSKIPENPNHLDSVAQPERGAGRRLPGVAGPITVSRWVMSARAHTRVKSHQTAHFVGSLLHVHHTPVELLGNEYVALAGEAQWTECWPANPKVIGLIPGQGTCLGCGPGPQLGVCKRQPIDVSLAHWHFSPSLSASLPQASWASGDGPLPAGSIFSSRLWRPKQQKRAVSQFWRLEVQDQGVGQVAPL